MTDDQRSEAAYWCDQVFGAQSGYFFFAFGVGGHFGETGRYEFDHWHERSGKWPDDEDRFLTEAIQKAGKVDVYVGPYLRTSPSRKKGNALPSHVVYADVDTLEPEHEDVLRQFIGPSGLLVDSGRGRHPYVWLAERLDPHVLEHLNRRLARKLGADAGWAENKVLRLPGTWNHKPRALGGESVPVRLVDFAGAPRDLTLAELGELLPDLPSMNGSAAGVIVPEQPANVPRRIQARLREHAGRDRSGQTFSFVKACIEEGLSDAETLALALQHAPTVAKYGERASGEVERSIQKLKTETAASEASEAENKIDWIRLSQVEMRSIVFLDKPLFQADAFHLVAGRKGMGKGTLLALIAASVTGGELGAHRNVLWIASEDSAAIDIKPRLIAAGGDPDRVTIPGRGWIQLPRDIDEISRVMTELGEVGMLVIDPVGNHIAGKSSNSETDIRDAIAPLNYLADHHHCMVFGVRHLTEKECTQGVLAAILGSSAWVQVPRAVLAVVRDDDDQTISHIQCVAGNRLPAGTPGRMFRIEGVLLPELENEVTRATWIGDSTKDVETMLAQSNVIAGKGPSKSAAARELILDMLDKVTSMESDTLDARIHDETDLAAQTIRNLRVKLKDAGLIYIYPEKDEDGAVLRWLCKRTLAPRTSHNPTPP